MKRGTIIIALASALFLTASCAPAPETQGTMNLDEIFATRRSVRDYDASKSISQEEVKTLLLAVQNAPSWANVQPTRYYVAISPEKVAAVRELVGEMNGRNVHGAPVLIVSTYVKGQSGFFGGNATNEVGEGWGAHDNGLSNAYLVLKAREMGFDTLIMGMRDADGLRQLLDIPENEAVMAVIALGYRASDPATPAHKNLEEVVRFF